MSQHMDSKRLKTCIECIARFENLKVFSLKIDFVTIIEPIDDCLSLIGQKCNKIVKLDLCVGYSVPISHQFYKTFTEFKAIKKLKIQ